ncbi:ArsR family transcriptional regulator [Bacteroidia bacterium]|nr:ArsR family transcriptional regulator [Bacteroidia bacterium]
MINVQELKTLIQAGEGHIVDFKRSVPSKVRDITEEICSFANADGGYVLIGVDDSNRIVGTSINNKTRSAIQGSISEISPALQVEMYPIIVDEKEIWVIEVPSGNRKPYIFSGVIYAREGANCQKLTTVEEIRDFFQQSDRIYFDTIACPKIDFLKSIDEDNLKKFRTESKLSADISDVQVFENLQIYDENGIIKRGGVLFFAKHPEETFPQVVIRCVLFKGTDKVYIIDDKTYGGALPQQYKQASEWLQSKLQVSYEIDGLGPRKDVWEIPLSVFKEAIINALAHRDYYEQGAVITIEMFDDRVEISNPGGLLSVVAKNFGRKSMTRNPIIFNLFTRMHLVERIASGIPRMRKDMQEAGLQEPVFQTEGMFTVIFYRPTKPISAKKEVKLDLSEIQLSILSLMQENPSITMSEIEKKLNRSNFAIYTNVKMLRENGLIQRVGEKKNGKWQVM